jgi:CubicO group peptidase (beta-lactamase class C family)
VRRAALAIAVLTAVLSLQIRTGAQSLTLSLFERYLDSLRETAGIPAVSALISQNRVEVWSRGMGRPNIESATPADANTPYPLGTLSQIFGSTLLLKSCVDDSYGEVTDLVRKWAPEYPEDATRIRDLLTHTATTGGFLYSPTRFAALTPVIVECKDTPYPRQLADDIFTRFGMVDSAPELVAAESLEPDPFSTQERARYAEIARRAAVGYRVDRGRATRNDVAPVPATAATGAVSTVRDLYRFDAALPVLLTPESRQAAWTAAVSRGVTLPTGMGWFVQQHNGQTLVWQYGQIDGAYSSMIIKVPARGITLILLANSDGLTAPFALEKGDATTSPFAQLFLRLLVP